MVVSIIFKPACYTQVYLIDTNWAEGQCAA